MSARDDETQSVSRANQAFYRAFESLDLEEMDEVWAHDGQVTCVHPGWTLAEGWTEVRQSWETIFRNTPEIDFDVTEERIDVRGDLAWVVCVERISSGADAGAVLATNVFRKDAHGEWRLVHHHGSPYVPPRNRPPAPPKTPKRDKKVEKKVLN
jgi:ketosteroid isomerase-like protein